jgi:hypothetical protein
MSKLFLDDSFKNKGFITRVQLFNKIYVYESTKFSVNFTYTISIFNGTNNKNYCLYRYYPQRDLNPYVYDGKT